MNAATVTSLHREAMDLAESAVLARVRGDNEKYNTLSRQAYEQEVQAARLVEDELQLEPTRSVLLRSAASLALDCGEWREAERLVAAALSGNPPEELAEELRDLLEQVNFRRHLDLRGIALEPTEVQFSIAGRSVGYGITASEEFLDRVRSLERLVHRTTERRMGLPFSEHTLPHKAAREQLELFISVPRAASFAVSLKFGRPGEPTTPPDPELAASFGGVIDEIMTGLEYINNGQADELRARIPDEAYYTNFLALARQLAPDGEDVNQVGFTAVRDGVERRVALTRKQSQLFFGLPVKAGKKPKKTMTVTGTLSTFDGGKSSPDKIKLTDSKGKTYTFSVPDGLMSDIVKPVWEELVEVSGYQRKKEIVLESISKL